MPMFFFPVVNGGKIHGYWSSWTTTECSEIYSQKPRRERDNKDAEFYFVLIQFRNNSIFETGSNKDQAASQYFYLVPTLSYSLRYSQIGKRTKPHYGNVYLII